MAQPTPFTQAVIIRVLTQAGRPEHANDPGGIAFIQHLLHSGHDRNLLSDALRNAHEAAGTGASARELYTLHERRNSASATTVYNFRMTLLEQLRPGYRQRHENDAQRRGDAQERNGAIPPQFASYLAVDKPPLEIQKDDKVNADLQMAAWLARQANQRTRRPAQTRCCAGSQSTDDARR